ncbi:hypothetical protein STCU_10815 [Strigomonas culicis]|uniref:Uncharacterized protein n=1 Tax=Strigomonas culicis TaxID=28005 RepID=S9V2V7_9TRYP|nr:hypothetical protein STCU_10815 [Strigomonas culicis]|eukprot:EPY17110.1 hypothetical protein STCU_10815 [Strigomonas culicis]
MRSHGSGSTAAQPQDGTLASTGAGDGNTSTGADTENQTLASEGAKESAGASLCIIFFACFENVKFAKLFAAHKNKELDLLKAVPSKEIKLIVPSKLRTVANHSFEEESSV